MERHSNDDPTPTFRPLGDQAVRVQFGDALTPAVTDAVRRFCLALEARPVPGVVECVPAYATVAVYYRPLVIGYNGLCDALAERLARTDDAPTLPVRTVEIPVRYGGPDGPDLDAVAAHCGLSSDEVARRHADPLYVVHFVGFLPGFPYLGGLPPELATPRLDTPRPRVPAGSVGIAGAQTGVYPRETPGGWRLVGRTDRVLYDPRRDPPALLRAGDRVRFVPAESP